MLLVSIDELIAHLPLAPDDRLYKLFVVPTGFAMVAKTTPAGWVAYRMGTFQFFGANKEVMHYREFSGIRRNAELFETFVARYQALAESNQQAEPEPEAAPQGGPGAPPRPAAPTARIDPSRLVDPDLHGLLLNTLHRATVDSDAYGRRFLEVVEQEVEPVIKELSSCLISPDVSTTALIARVRNSVDR